MRTFIVLASILSFSLTYAQRGGGGMGGGQGGGRQGGGQGGQQQQRPEIREFNASEVAGIFSYDIDEAVKKIKLKKDKALILSVKKAIANYNTKVSEIGLLNKDNFDTLNVYMNSLVKSSMANRNQNRNNQQTGYGTDNNEWVRGENNPMREANKLAKEKIEPAKEAVKNEEIKLNNGLEFMLKEKQYKKWLKYQDDFKEDMNPKPKSNNNQQGGGMQMRSGGGGQGGGRGMR